MNLLISLGRIAILMILSSPVHEQHDLSLHYSIFDPFFNVFSFEDADSKLFFFVFSRVAPMAYGGSQARVLIRAVAASLCQSNSNARSELRLQPTPQLTAMPDP